jgi:hypothetical protein
LAGERTISDIVAEALAQWIASQRTVSPEVQPPVPAVATPSAEGWTVVPQRPWNAYRPPGSP